MTQRGITLVDWDGYMANPLIRFYVLPPANAVLSGSAKLTANGGRLYFDNPSTVSTNGPSKTLTLTNANSRVAVGLSIFPDRDGLDEDYTLTIVFTGANNAKQTNTIPIHVRDLDLQRTNEFVVTENFQRDITGFFNNPAARAVVKLAADDWSYFFTSMNLDPVLVGTETTYIWSNNFSGGYYFKNTNSYTGYLLYPYGITNSNHSSSAEGSYSGPVQKSGGVPLTIKRSGGFEAETNGNYNTLGWLYLTNDNEWLITGSYRDETNDFYSITHHETGHALIFNEAHLGFNSAFTIGGFTNALVTNYYGGIVPIDSSDHLGGVIDPESGQGAFGNEYSGSIPRRRWLITKLDLLCAQQVGYTLHSNSIFTPLAFPSNALPAAAMTIPFNYSFTATGGIPFYNWEIMAGSLPPGISLDSFTGLLSGMPATNGVFNFSVRLRDYHETAIGASQSFTLNVAPPPRPQLTLSIVGQGESSNARLLLYGTTGQRQV
ncbi:MAG: Ig domain-containing protein, partial [Verrucomicrobiota bacterium]|nr:Ig domain-containing protein [Verrucomicrobiota bacterium]